MKTTSIPSVGSSVIEPKPATAVIPMVSDPFAGVGARMPLALLVCLWRRSGRGGPLVLNTSIQRWWSRAFPLSTFVINVLATFCAGVAAAAYASMAVEQSTYLLFVTGFLGGFSTFSTAINEMVSLARNGRFAMAAGICWPRWWCRSCAWRWAGWSVGGALNRTPVFGVLCFRG